MGELLKNAAKLSDGRLNIMQGLCSAIQVGVLLGYHERLRLLLLRLLKQGLSAIGKGLHQKHTLALLWTLGACSTFWMHFRSKHVLAHQQHVLLD